VLSQVEPRDAAVNFGTLRYYAPKFTATSRSFHCDSTAFELNRTKNHGKICLFNIYCLKIYDFKSIWRTEYRQTDGL